MSLFIQLHSIECLNESNEASASDEVYVLATIAALRPAIPGVPAVPNFRVFRYGIYEDMDDDDGPRVVEEPAFWGMDGAPAEILDPADVGIVVSVIEQDNGVPEQYQELVNARAGLSLAASAGAPTPQARAARLASDIGNVLNGIDLPIPFALDDDHIGTQQLVLDASDLVPFGARDKTMVFSGDGAEYRLTFRIRRLPRWAADWFPLPGQHVFDHQTQHLAAVSRAPGNLDLFVIGFDNRVYTTWWPDGGSGNWRPDWIPLPGQHVFDHQKQHIAAVSRAPGNLDLFVIGFDNRVYSTFWNQGGGWAPDWFPLPGQHVFDHQTQHLAAVSRAPGNLDLFVIGFDNRVYTTWWPDGGSGNWRPDWIPLPGQHVFDHQKQHIAAVSRAPGNLDLFVIGFDNRVYSTFWNQGGGWAPDWFPLPGQHVFDHQTQHIAAVSRAPGNLDLYVIGFDNRVYTTWWPDGGSGNWRPDWIPLPGQHVFDHQKQHIAAVSRAPGNLDLFVIGFDNRVYSTFWNQGGGWAPDWFPLPGQHVFDHQTQHIAAVSRAPGNLDLFVIGFDNHIYSTFWAAP